MLRAFLLLAFMGAALPAMAQDTAESRLRDMLRKTTTDLRTAEDTISGLQASLDQEKQQATLLRQQLDALKANPPDTGKVAAAEAEIARVRADAEAQMTTLQAGVKQWQDAYQKAADIARSKDGDARTALARAEKSEQQARICATANTKLEAVAFDILHLYQTQDFRSLLLGSYEPLLGFKKVELQNTIQDYEDKILDQKYRPGQIAQKPEAAK